MITHPTPVRNTLADAIATLVDGGSGAGKLKIYSASFATLLATFTLPDPAFAAASSGKIVGDSISSTTGSATGTAAVFRVTDSADVECFAGTTGVAGSGADAILTSTAITSGAPTSCSKLEYNAPP
jgi:hypothetical protein